MLLENTKMTQHYAPQMQSGPPTAVSPTELDRTFRFAVTRTDLLLLPLGAGDLRLDPETRGTVLMQGFSF